MCEAKQDSYHMESQGNPIPHGRESSFLERILRSAIRHISVKFLPHPLPTGHISEGPSSPMGALGGLSSVSILKRYQKCDLGLALAKAKNQTTRTREWDCGDFFENWWKGNLFSHVLMAGFEGHFPRWALKQWFSDARCCVVCKSVCRWMCWVHRLCWCLMWGTRVFVQIAPHYDLFCVYIFAGNVNRTQHVI